MDLRLLRLEKICRSAEIASHKVLSCGCGFTAFAVRKDLQGWWDY